MFIYSFRRVIAWHACSFQLLVVLAFYFETDGLNAITTTDTKSQSMQVQYPSKQSVDRIVHAVSSVFLTVAFNSIVTESLHIWYMVTECAGTPLLLWQHRTILKLRLVLKCLLFNVMALLYWFSVSGTAVAPRRDSTVRSLSPHAYYVLYWVVSVITLVPIMLVDLVCQIAPSLSGIRAGSTRISNSGNNISNSDDSNSSKWSAPMRGWMQLYDPQSYLLFNGGVGRTTADKSFTSATCSDSSDSSTSSNIDSDSDSSIGRTNGNEPQQANTSSSLQQWAFWLVVLATKVCFSYQYEIKPLVQPTRQLWQYQSQLGRSG